MHLIFKGIKFMVSLVLRIILLPVVFALTIVQGICLVAAHFSSLLFDFAGGVIIVTGILSYYFQLEPVSEMWRMIAIGTGLCILPMLVHELAEWVVLIKTSLMIRMLT